MLFLASSMRGNVRKKDRSSQVQIPSTLVVYLVFSADQNGQFDRFERFCVPLADLLLGLRIFVVNHFGYQTSKSLPSSLSRPLLKCFNRQARKRNSLAKERVANLSLGVVEVHVTYTCPLLDITAIINFFLATKIFLWRPFCN